MLAGIRDGLIIYNPLSGRRRHRRVVDLEKARAILGEAGIETELAATTGSGSATELAREAVGRERDLVIVCGGDGTINEAVNGLAGSRVPLAVLPAGTANVLAKELRIPWSIPKAAQLIPRCTLRRIALGLAAPLAKPGKGRYFLCVAGAGPDGRIVYSLAPGWKLRTGIASYWFEGFRQLVRYNFPQFRLRAAGREALATLVVVGRTKHYGGPFRITTGASLLENSFEVVVLTTRSRGRYLSYLPVLWLGLLRKMRDVQYWKAESVCCEPLGAETVHAQVDGEPAGRLAMEFRIAPDALTLAIPETAPSAGA